MQLLLLQQQPPGIGSPSRLHHIGLDLRVVQQELSRKIVVGLDATNTGSIQNHRIRRRLLHTLLHGMAFQTIQGIKALRQQ